MTRPFCHRIGDVLLRNGGEKTREGFKMLSSSRLRSRFPVGTKYVVESCGERVRRYVEFPNGRKVQLATRKALSCTCAELQRVTIAPDQNPAVLAPPPSPIATISRCPQCAGVARIKLIEPDLKYPHKALHIFQCQECGLPRNYLIDRNRGTAVLMRLKAAAIAA
jgi:hypothetical protein